MNKSVLADIAPEQFLREHWQKKPLVVRQAIPGFAGIVDKSELFALTRLEHVDARAVVTTASGAHSVGAVYEVVRRASSKAHASAPSASVLVAGLESLVPGGWELLAQFGFIPRARVDDLMVSWASEGGGVGPHVDQYDVFLLQGPGRRRWRLSHPVDVSALDDDAYEPRSLPLRILRDFPVALDVTLDPGDMLYLPPGVPHWGTAVDGECFTYSIGFLAPSHESLVQNYLLYLGQVLDERMPPGLYADPDLAESNNASTIDRAMIARVGSILDVVRNEPDDVADFTGRLLTGPKPSTVFAPPGKRLSRAKLADKPRVTLALPSRALRVEHGNAARVFVNGDAVEVPTASELVTLVDMRACDMPTDEATLDILYAWYTSGWVEV
ncbi:MAG TPA: cupin domain-containing protein [Myxococcota bacterium]